MEFSFILEYDGCVVISKRIYREQIIIEVGNMLTYGKIVMIGKYGF